MVNFFKAIQNVKNSHKFIIEMPGRCREWYMSAESEEMGTEGE
jgi:hypothetical protein